MNNLNKPFALFTGTAVITLALTGCSLLSNGGQPTGQPTAEPQVVQQTATPVEEAAPTDTAVPAEPTDPVAEWQNYSNENYQITFQFPAGWFGPDVYEVENEVRLAVGSDKVYPYGTDRTEQIYTEANSYYITIQYRMNPGYTSLEEYSQAQPWFDTYLAMLNLEAGETITGPRSKEIKVKDLAIGQFQGVEYIATLSDTAQTEYVYIRQAFLLDDDLNLLMVMGTPNNVEIPSGEDWREAYRKVDQEHQAIFDQVLESIQVEQED